MTVGLMVVTLFAGHCRSLKDKRQTLSSLKERLKQKFNVAVAESDFQDLWQKIQLGIVSVSNSRTVLDKLFRQIEEFICSEYPLQITEIRVQYL